MAILTIKTVRERFTVEAKTEQRPQVEVVRCFDAILGLSVDKSKCLLSFIYSYTKTPGFACRIQSVLLLLLLPHIKTPEFGCLT